MRSAVRRMIDDEGCSVSKFSDFGNFTKARSLEKVSLGCYVHQEVDARNVM